MIYNTDEQGVGEGRFRYARERVKHEITLQHCLYLSRNTVMLIFNNVTPRVYIFVLISFNIDRIF